MSGGLTPSGPWIRGYMCVCITIVINPFHTGYRFSSILTFSEISYVYINM